jgi:hypothetical protein
MLTSMISIHEKAVFPASRVDGRFGNVKNHPHRAGDDDSQSRPQCGVLTDFPRRVPRALRRMAL